MVIIDASVALSWCFADERSAYSDAVYAEALAAGALVPSLWTFEIANTLAMAERRQRITPPEIGAFVALLNDLAITTVDTPTVPEIDRLIGLARLFRLTAYDAAYLDVAIRTTAPLASLDEDLRSAVTAAGATLFVPP